MRPNKRIAKEGFEMPSMTNDLYKLRRVVIDEIYRIKKTYSKLPRLDVRIVNPKEGTACGYAWLSSNIIHINSKWVNSPQIPEIVAHEIVHAVVGFMHDEKCPLMSPCCNYNALSYEKVDECLEKYLADYK
jgi:hypothetical protein